MTPKIDPVIADLIQQQGTRLRVKAEDMPGWSAERSLVAQQRWKPEGGDQVESECESEMGSVADVEMSAESACGEESGEEGGGESGESGEESGEESGSESCGELHGGGGEESGEEYLDVDHLRYAGQNIHEGDGEQSAEAFWRELIEEYRSRVYGGVPRR